MGSRSLGASKQNLDCQKSPLECLETSTEKSYCKVILTLYKLTLNPHNQTMKNKNTTLNFTNVCNIRTYLILAIQGEIKSHKDTKRYWGVTSGMTKMSRNRIGDMISAYRAAKNIKIVY